ncbi:MAG: hypothetical protein K2O24_08600 [Muribaculaceae bacterium]|nr:hypothetical protein [Muribaculaceae bacterium]
MTARDAISPIVIRPESPRTRSVDSDMPLVDVLPRLLDAPGRLLEVRESGLAVGTIDEASMLTALGLMLAPRDDSSLITVACRPEDYSASLIAHAVEDAGVHLVDLWTVPSEEGWLKVTLRVRCLDPSAVVRSLERYDFTVTDVHGGAYSNPDIARERIEALQVYLNV